LDGGEARTRSIYLGKVPCHWILNTPYVVTN
jgi:hypothetical protein